MSAQLFQNYDTSKIFIGNNRYITANYTNGSGSEVTLTAGRLMGRVYADNKVAVHLATATNGTEQPIGVLADTYVVANGATVAVSICIAGDVATEKVTFSGSEALTTVVTRTYTDSATNTVAVAWGTIGDLLLRNSQIILVAGTELTGYDNA